MSKVVFLLGAGASYGKRINSEELTMDDVSLIEEGLPLVFEIKDELEYVNGWLNNVELKDRNYTLFGEKCDVFKMQDELLKGFDWMLEQSAHHATIDTFAKKLYLKGDTENYARLKYLLTTFFLVEQSLHPYDKRYDTFFANILDSDLNIPNDIYLMTWNYDVQLDIAYQDYNIKGLPMCCPPETRNVDYNAKVFKINGSANYYNMNHLDSAVLSKLNPSDLLGLLFNQLSIATQKGYYRDGTTDLLFAWEKDIFNAKCNILYQNISDAEVMVVIGYTFPFFNREIDREIFSKMPNLKKIYVQDPKANKVKVSTKSILPSDKYKCMLDDEDLIFDTSNFFLPPEL